MTRATENWSEFPGSFDTVNATLGDFPATNWYGIPTIYRTPDLVLPRTLVNFGVKTESVVRLKGPCWHFYLDDYRFERVWNCPRKYLPPILRVGITLTPDFSVYSDWPMYRNLWNVGRNRLLGAWWQSLGVTVIPSISWGGPDSFEYCFQGVEEGAVVAIGPMERGPEGEDRENYLNGYKEMVRQIRPEKVVIYGKEPPELRGLVETVCYPTFSMKMRKRLQRGEKIETGRPEQENKSRSRG